MKYCKYFYKLSFYIQHVYDCIYLYVNFCKMFIHSALTSNNHFLYDGGGIYKSPFNIQSKKRSTKLILTQSVDQTKLNKPHTINTISRNSSVVLQLVKIIEIMSPCHNITICNNTTAVRLCKLTNIVHKLHFV